MENLLLSFRVILPVFLSIALGYLLRRIRILNDAGAETMNALSFKVFLPVYLFQNIYKTDLEQAFHGRLLLFAVAAVCALFAVLMLTVPHIEKDKPRCGVLIQGIFRSNFALFGLPVALSLLGEEKIGPTSLLLGTVVPVYNVLAVVALETFRGGKPNLGKIALGIVKNPLIIGTVIGILWNLFGPPLPEALAKWISTLGNVATPLSLIALGAGFTFRAARRNLKPLTLALLGRLVFSPLVTVAAAAALGFRKELLAPVLIFSGAPTAVSSYPMAQQMGGDAELAGEIVVFTSAFSVLTMFLWIFVLKQLALI